MAKSKNESNNKNSGTLLTEKDGTQYFVMGKVRIKVSEHFAQDGNCLLYTSQNAMLQNTTDISFVRIYRTENMTTDKSKMVVASIMQTLFKESFFEIIFALLQSTYSPYHKRF